MPTIKLDDGIVVRHDFKVSTIKKNDLCEDDEYIIVFADKKINNTYLSVFIHESCIEDFENINYEEIGFDIVGYFGTYIINKFKFVYNIDEEPTRLYLKSYAVGQTNGKKDIKTNVLTSRKIREIK